jgi:hypothetical protein
MALSTKSEVRQENTDFFVKGVLEHHAAGELASDKAQLTGSVVSIKRTLGGGIDYEFKITKSEPAAAGQVAGKAGVPPYRAGGTAVAGTTAGAPPYRASSAGQPSSSGSKPYSAGRGLVPAAGVPSYRASRTY